MAARLGALGRLSAKRPWSSLGVVSATVGISSASYVEYQANRAELQWLLREDQDAESASSDRPPPRLPRTYDANDLHAYWSIRPVTAVTRLVHIGYELGPLLVRFLWNDYVIGAENDKEEHWRHHAQQLREALTNLGPAFVKAGQQLSIRPDLVPPVVLEELQHLCDSVRPIPDEMALNVLQSEWNLTQEELRQTFPQLRMVASASLGQVYKAKLRRRGNGKDDDEYHYVAIKVQRPGMTESFSLDLFLLQRWGVVVDCLTRRFTHQQPYHQEFLQAFARGSYQELDYELEAANQRHFRNEFMARNCPVVVPTVYEEYTTRRVLTTSWIDGIRLSDAPQDTIQKLIPVGVELFLTQLLDIGTFHSDPHPGNLLVTPDGRLCLLDFGLCAQVDEKSRAGMTTAIFHLLQKDFDTLVHEDSKTLGFLPQDFDTTELKPILTKILTEGVLESGSDLRKRKRKLMEISNELNQVFFRYPFSVPPYFALITRGLGLLEGIALTGDPEFDIFRASAPFATLRAMRLLGKSSMTRMRQHLTSTMADRNAQPE